MNGSTWELVRAPLGWLRRSVLWASLGMGGLIGATMAFWPALQGSTALDDLIGQLPSGIVDAFGLAEMGSPAGYLRGNLYDVLVPLLLAITAAVLATGPTASEEASGRLELYLAQPVSRTRLFLGRTAAAAISLVVVVVVALAVQLAMDFVVGLDLPVEHVVAAMLASGLLAAMYGALALLLAGWRGAPSMSLGVPVALAIAGYIVSALFPLVSAVAPLRHLSPWDWALGGDPLANGIGPLRVLVLVLVIIVLVLAGARLFRDRDIASA